MYRSLSANVHSITDGRTVFFSVRPIIAVAVILWQGWVRGPHVQGRGHRPVLGQ